MQKAQFDGFSFPLEVQRRCSHDWAACCSRLHSSGELECVLLNIVTKTLESSTNTDICVFHWFLLFGFVEFQPEDVSSIVLMIGTLINVYSFPADSLPLT